MVRSINVVLVLFVVLFIGVDVLGFRQARRNRAQVLAVPSRFGFSNIVQLYVGEEKADGEYKLVSENGTIPCNGNGKFAIIVHGWRESCSTEWVTDLVKKLRQYRGGCVICLDYSRVGNERYRVLMTHFGLLYNSLTSLLHNLEESGFDPNNGYMFGFSFGARVVTQAAGTYGYQRIAKIDVCDPARPGFDRRQLNLIDPEMAAKNVQCIHTSQDKGTLIRNCHQDWLMGKCGIEQDAATDPPYGSHGLCPHFYVSAFDHEFCAVYKPSTCFSNRLALDLPSRFRMGYMENRTSEIRGDLFALTSSKFPYNVDVLSNF